MHVLWPHGCHLLIGFRLGNSCSMFGATAGKAGSDLGGLELSRERFLLFCFSLVCLLVFLFFFFSFGYHRFVWGDFFVEFILVNFWPVSSENVSDCFDEGVEVYWQH